MELTKEAEKCLRKEMLKNLAIIKKNRYLSIKKKAAILKESFLNYHLRFIVINGKKYPTDSKMQSAKGFFWKYTNPHEKNIRISYDEKNQILFKEIQEMVRHPGLVNQKRITGEEASLCSLFGYRRFGYIDPGTKVPKWIKKGQEIAVNKISSLKIISFWDKPKAIWIDGEDYTAYKIIIKTKT